jgi:hypothetical protein
MESMGRMGMQLPFRDVADQTRGAFPRWKQQPVPPATGQDELLGDVRVQIHLAHPRLRFGVRHDLPEPRHLLLYYDRPALVHQVLRLQGERLGNSKARCSEQGEEIALPSPAYERVHDEGLHFRL